MKKDIEWLKSAIQQNLDFYNDNDEEWQMAKVRAYAKSLDLINQLDEPEVKQLDKKIRELESYNDELIRDNNQFRNELDNQEVLSQEWINNHTYHEDEYDFYYADPDELKNLLVSKQEEVDRAYRKGFKEGKRQTAEYFESITEEPNYGQVQKYLSERGFKVVDKEPETVADVVSAFWKSFERLKEVMSMEVEELEE